MIREYRASDRAWAAAYMEDEVGGALHVVAAVQLLDRAAQKSDRGCGCGEQ